MWELVTLLVLALLAWFWFDSLRSRERALAAAMRACEREGLQFLDGAAACIALRAARNEDGHMALRRTYRFEFSDDRYHRRSGTVTLLGSEVEALELEPFLLH
jgi:hypothetical protein